MSHSISLIQFLKTVFYFSNYNAECEPHVLTNYLGVHSEQHQSKSELHCKVQRKPLRVTFMVLYDSQFEKYLFGYCFWFFLTSALLTPTGACTLYIHKCMKNRTSKTTAVLLFILFST